MDALCISTGSTSVHLRIFIISLIISYSAPFVTFHLSEALQKITIFFCSHRVNREVIFLRTKFILSMCLGLLWLAVSVFFAVGWAQELSCLFPAVYVWWVIIGIALLPGLLMSTMFFSNLLHQKLKKYPDTQEDTTIIMCAHNEEQTISQSIRAIANQQYRGHIRLIVVDNASTDHTKQVVLSLQEIPFQNGSLEYAYCGQLGKANALNTGLALVCTPYLITVDADTTLEKTAVQSIMNHLVSCGSACVAGNLLVQNTKSSLIARMQIYDYLLSIAAIKRFQGSYGSTLVAQGAFSAYQTEAVRSIGGWQRVLGEDIVLTYQLIYRGLPSSYEPGAVGYTTVPETLKGLYHQRKRWAIGMLEGLRTVPPWKHRTLFSRYFTFVNLSILYLDLSFVFGFVPGVILALLGYPFFVGVLTLFTAAVCILLHSVMYLYQKKLQIPFENSISGFVCFLLFFQTIQSTAALHGYLIRLTHRKTEW